MINIFYIFVSIIILFFILLIIKGFFGKYKEKICVICTAVCLTWVGLLILYWAGIFEDKVIIALLIGQSILGIYYITESKVKEELKIFRLPFLLTLIIIGYSLLIVADDIVRIIILLLGLWLIFICFS